MKPLKKPAPSSAAQKKPAPGKKPLRIGIAGAGVVGGALASWLNKATTHEVVLHDPDKGLTSDLAGADMVFVCVPAPTLPDRTQDLSAIREVISRFAGLRVPFLVRTTVLPGTCDKLSAEVKSPVCAIPEFLTERRAARDFADHGIVVGRPDLNAHAEKWLKEKMPRVFPNKHLIQVPNVAAELGKYAHNAFAAVKVSFCNSVLELASQVTPTVLYTDVRKVMQLTGYMGVEHLDVPGHDGKPGYGGKCLPKDLAAFIGWVEETGGYTDVLLATERQNTQRRDDVERFSVEDAGEGKPHA